MVHDYFFLKSLDKVRPGGFVVAITSIGTMDKLGAQVREILGTSLLTDIFHSNRWDYVFTIRRQGVEPQERRFTVFFNGEQLERWEGGEMPSEEEFVATLDTRKKTGKVPPLEATEEELKKFDPKGDRKATDTESKAPATLPPLPAAYPPLEAAR